MEKKKADEMEMAKEKNEKNKEKKETKAKIIL